MTCNGEASRTGVHVELLTSESENKPFVLVYTTAPRSKPSYRRGILDALCYPNGHVIQYSYRRHHIHPVLLKKNDKNDPLKGKAAVIVFVDIDKDKNVTYFPLRRVQIRNVLYEIGTTRPPLDRERVSLSLLLQDFVEYKPSAGHTQWNELVRKFDGQRQISNGIPKYFVIGGRDDFPKCEHSVALAWEDLVTSVSESPAFQDAVFVRLDHIEPDQSDRGTQQLHGYERDRLVYSLSPGNIYRLNLSVFENPPRQEPPKKETRLEVRASARDILDTVQPFQSLVSGLVEKSTLIACKRTIENVMTTLTVRVDHETSSALVNSPSPTLFVRVSVSRKILFAFAVCVLLGGLGVAIDTDLVRELCICARPATWALVAKGVGAVFLAVAAFLAFRKLPSAGR